MGLGAIYPAYALLSSIFIFLPQKYDLILFFTSEIVYLWTPRIFIMPYKENVKYFQSKTSRTWKKEFHPNIENSC